MTATLDGVGVRLEENGVLVAWVLPAFPPIRFYLLDGVLVLTTTPSHERWGTLHMPMLAEATS